MLVQLTSSAEIRQVRQYSNISYIVASHVVTTLSGMPFTDFVTTRIFDRLGMKDTTYDITRVTQSGKRVHSFVRTGVDERKAENAWNMHNGSEDSDIPLDCLGNPTCYDWVPGSDIVHNAGAGGIWTTAADMVCRNYGLQSFSNGGLDALATRSHFSESHPSGGLYRHHLCSLYPIRRTGQRRNWFLHLRTRHLRAPVPWSQGAVPCWRTTGTILISACSTGAGHWRARRIE
jgi:CubicO group peptidase (beta-lactamase class C family)